MGLVIRTLENDDIEKYGDHMTSTFSEYTLWRGLAKSTLCMLTYVEAFYTQVFHAFYIHTARIKLWYKVNYCGLG